MNWPPMGPDINIGSGNIPAESRFITGDYIQQPDDISTGDKPAAPRNLRVVD